MVFFAIVKSKLLSLVELAWQVHHVKSFINLKEYFIVGR